MIDKTLYHFTCGDHGFDAIQRDGFLKAGEITNLVWLTDFQIPIAKPLGLTQETILCDRTEYRFRVTDNSTVERWVDVRREMPPEMMWLELAPGVMPMHWYVSAGPVPVVYDPRS